jgi:cell division protein FtsW (lipid II flippase)
MQRNKKLKWQLFWTLFGVVAVVCTVILFLDALEQKDNLRIIMRGLLIVYFSILTVGYGLTYNRLRKEKEDTSL